MGAHPTLMESLQFQIVGLAVVMVALSGLWLLVRLMGLLFGTTSGPAEQPRGALSPELLAVIAAALHVSLRTPHRIVSITELDEMRLMTWSEEGRRQIFSSHKIR